MRTSAEVTTCPTCGHLQPEIVYGMPDEELFKASERGEVILGGCCLPGPGMDELVKRECAHCGHQWTSTESWSAE